MKKVILVLLLVMLLISGCVPNDVDAEIKELVKDIPQPIRYDKRSGELAEPEKIVVTNMSGGGEIGRNHDPKTGKDTTIYRVSLIYNSGFWNNGYQAYLSLWVANSQLPDYGFIRQHFTLEEIKTHINEMYWD